MTNVGQFHDISLACEAYVPASCIILTRLVYVTGAPSKALLPVTLSCLLVQYMYEFDLMGLYSWAEYVTQSEGADLGPAAIANGVAGHSNLLDVPPSLYGYRGCTCLANYYSVLTQDTDGGHSLLAMCLAGQLPLKYT